MRIFYAQWGRLGLQTRLLTAFGLLALIALLLAGTGYVSTKRVGAYVQEVGGETLPAMENLLRAQQQLEVIPRAGRTPRRAGSDFGSRLTRRPIPRCGP